MGMARSICEIYFFPVILSEAKMRWHGDVFSYELLVKSVMTKAN